MHPALIPLLNHTQGSISEQGRKYSPLRRPRISTDKLIFIEDTCFEERTDEAVHSYVSTAATDALQNVMVINLIEAAFYVALNNPRVGIPIPFSIVRLHT